MTLPNDKQARKERPMARGALDYFPDALAEVAHVSFIGNQQHNPGQEMHWARGKSDDHADCIIRHLVDRGTLDDDGLRHSAKAAWRALALLQIELEKPVKDEPAVTATEIWSAVRDDPFTDFLQESREKMMFEAPTLDGIPRTLAALIAAGTTRPAPVNPGSIPDWTAYVAGPMRGHDRLNFPAFDRARDYLVSQGVTVISPADIDRASGIREDDYGSGGETVGDNKTFIERDFHAVMSLDPDRGDFLCLLPGWERSVGATAEFFLARWIGLDIRDRHGQPLVAFDAEALTRTVTSYLSVVAAHTTG